MLEPHDDFLKIHWPDNKSSQYHWVWLRDFCSCPRCFNANCRQKYFDTYKIPLDLRPTSLAVVGDKIRIRWTDEHLSEYSLAWLRRNDYEQAAPLKSRLAATPMDWNRSGVPSGARFNRLELLQFDETLGQVYDALFRYGIVVIRGDHGGRNDFVPLCDRLAGFLDRSYFGEYFDLEVKPEETTDSISFSTKELPLHTDIPYYAPPPDFQFLFGLDISPSCIARGIGNTRFVDGFAAADRLRRDWPELFAILTQTMVVYRAEYPLARKVYESVTPIIRLDPTGTIERLINNPSKMYLDGVGFHEMLPLYRAYQKFKQVLTHDAPAYSHPWDQGDLVIWDNRRVFHGRGEFGEAGISRTLRGGYFREVELKARARFLGRANETATAERTAV